MAWWAALILAGLGVLAVGLFPWKIVLHMSTVRGLSLETKLLGRANVFSLCKGFAQTAQIRFLGLKINLKARDKTTAPKVPGEEDKKREAGAPTGSGRAARRLRAALGNMTIDTFCVLARYFRDITGNTKVQLEISGELGLDDPASTGMACGLAWCLFGACGMKKVDLRPNFLVPVIAGEFKLVVSIVPLRMILHTVKTLLHPSVRRVWLALIAPRRAVIIREVQGLGS